MLNLHVQYLKYNAIHFNTLLYISVGLTPMISQIPHFLLNERNQFSRAVVRSGDNLYQCGVFHQCYLEYEYGMGGTWGHRNGDTGMGTLEWGYRSRQNSPYLRACYSTPHMY